VIRCLMMKSFLCPRPTRFLSSLTLPVLVASVVASVVGCGGTGADTLFGSGGASAGTATTASNSSSGATSSSGTAGTTSSGTAGTTSSSSTSSGSGGSVAACQAGYTCVDADPAGWTGHYYVTETALPAAAAPACPANLTAHTDHTGPAGAAQCTACTCGALQGAACAPPDLTCYAGSTTCAGTATDLTVQLENGACDKPALPGVVVLQASCKLTSPATVSAAGTCAPSATDFPNKQSWATRIDACGADTSAGACGAGKVCVPDGSGAAGESLCIRQDGTATCPAGWTKVIQGYGSSTDTRACGACTCGGGDTTCVDSHYTFYSSASCTTNPAMGSTSVASAQCTDVSADLGGARATLPTAKGNCPAGGGAATGAVTPLNPFTYCCQ